ncbi:MAG: hypothetical protein HY321_17870 [Armatimonadetes bacterium]|nr:hypothetical protein [Armatimonadota bacterium]
MRDDAITTALDAFKPRVVWVAKRRYGLETGVPLTLDQVGRQMGLTRMRVWHLEQRFWRWRPLRSPSVVRRFVAAFLLDLASEGGRLLVPDEGLVGCRRRFLAKVLDVPCTQLRECDLWVLGCPPPGVPLMESDPWSPDDIDDKSVGSRLNRGTQEALGSADIERVAHAVVSRRRQRLDAGKRVHLALRAIGRPAHYSEVTQEHNVLFPDHAAIERNILAVLHREDHGVVWVGCRGTYALAEWGYERPSRPLSDMVTEIVRATHESTGNPVSFVTIMTEAGRQRRTLNRSSLYIAASLNPRLVRLSGDLFVPAEEGKSDEDAASELDRVLRELEAESGSL